MQVLLFIVVAQSLLFAVYGSLLTVYSGYSTVGDTAPIVDVIRGFIVLHAIVLCVVATLGLITLAWLLICQQWTIGAVPAAAASLVSLAVLIYPAFLAAVLSYTIAKGGRWTIMPGANE